MICKTRYKLKEKCNIEKSKEVFTASSLDKIIKLPFKFRDEVLAVGGQLKSAFCLAKDNQVFISKTLGDLEDLETLSGFESSIEQLSRRLKIKPKIIACDMHPEYLSTKFAQDYVLRFSQCKLIKIQHHHAHITSCMADNNLKNTKVIGVAFDGTGFGSDGNLWGAEFLIADYSDFKRAAYFDYIPLLGGAQAIKEPWRLAVAHLYKTYSEDFLKLDIDFVHRLDKPKWSIFKKMIDMSINVPMSSSVGRLFDAVSSLVGIRDSVDYEGHAAVELEKVINMDAQDSESYRYGINENQKVFIVDSGPMIKEIVKDIKADLSKAKISVKFHNTISKIIVEVSKRIRKTAKINQVALSGGVFQNRYLFKKALDDLSSSDFKVLTHRRISPTDAGICLGQVAVAKWRNQ